MDFFFWWSEVLIPISFRIDLLNCLVYPLRDADVLKPKEDELYLPMSVFEANWTITKKAATIRTSLSSIPYIRLLSSHKPGPAFRRAHLLSGTIRTGNHINNCMARLIVIQMIQWFIKQYLRLKNRAWCIDSSNCVYIEGFDWRLYKSPCRRLLMSSTCHGSALKSGVGCEFIATSRAAVFSVLQTGYTKG